MGPVGVVVGDPRVDRGLRLVQRLVNGSAASRKSGRTGAVEPSPPSRSGSVRPGAVSRWVIPLLRQILSNSTSPCGPYLPNRSVNCLPLSVMISSGTPNRASASASARHTARPVARSTTAAITQNREWSSTAGDDLGLPQLPGRRVDQPHPADDVDLPQLHRPRPLQPPIRVPRPLPGPGPHSPCRIRIRSIVRSDGTTIPGRPTGRAAQHLQPDPPRPHRGCSRRISATATSTASAT